MLDEFFREVQMELRQRVARLRSYGISSQLHVFREGAVALFVPVPGLLDDGVHIALPHAHEPSSDSIRRRPSQGADPEPGMEL